jgi:hypothetical protein
MRAPFRFMLSLALTLGIAAPAMADPPLVPPACKLRGAKRVTVGNFQFSKADLETYQAQNPIVSASKKRCPAGSDRRRATLAEIVGPSRPAAGSALRVGSGAENAVAWCGIVDKWLYAAKSAYDYCNSSALGNGNGYFVIASPANFNDTDHHHDLYTSYDSGLSGSCYVCTESRIVGPATVLPKEEIKLPTPAKGD